MNNHTIHLIISLSSYLKNDWMNVLTTSFISKIFTSHILACKDSRFYSVRRYHAQVFFSLFASALIARSVDINISLIFLWYSWKSATRYCVLLMLRRVRRMFFFRLVARVTRSTSERKFHVSSPETGWAGGKLIKC